MRSGIIKLSELLDYDKRKKSFKRISELIDLYGDCDFYIKGVDGHRIIINGKHYSLENNNSSYDLENCSKKEWELIKKSLPSVEGK